MIELAADLVEPLQVSLAVGFIVFLRIGASVAALPAFGERSIPARIRLAVTFAFTLVVAPAVAASVEQTLYGGMQYWLLLSTEVSIGLVLGLLMRFFILTLQIAGTIAAQSTSLSQIFGTAAMEPLPAMGHLMVVGGLALATLSGLHVQVAAAMIATYDIFPPGVFPVTSLIADWGVARVSETFSLAFTLSAPFVIASLIYNLTLGVINKAMPQLMVAFVGAPAITLGGLVLLFLSMPVLLAVWNEEFQTFLANPFRAR